jgi:PII-like signaling protein
MADERVAAISPPARLLIAVFDARDEWEDAPLHEALIRVLETHGIAGATVLSGMMGYGAHRSVHRKGLMIGAPHDRPTVLLVVENETKLRQALPIIRSMIAEGVVLLTDAEVIPTP